MALWNQYHWTYTNKDFLKSVNILLKIFTIKNKTISFIPQSLVIGLLVPHQSVFIQTDITYCFHSLTVIPAFFLKRYWVLMYEIGDTNIPEYWPLFPWTHDPMQKIIPEHFKDRLHIFHLKHNLAKTFFFTRK